MGRAVCALTGRAARHESTQKIFLEAALSLKNPLWEVLLPRKRAFLTTFRTAVPTFSSRAEVTRGGGGVPEINSWISQQGITREIVSGIAKVAEEELGT